MTKEVTRLYQELIDLGLLDDRREYTEDDLKGAYPDLTSRDVRSLYNTIQGNFVIINKSLTDNFKEYMEESEHGGWEGWTPEQVMTIYQLLQDIKLYDTIKNDQT